jgi:hypothetical protein
VSVAVCCDDISLFWWNYFCALICCDIFSILGRIIRVTDEVIDYRAWIRETFPVPNHDDDDSLSSSSDAMTSESGTGSDTVSVSHQLWYVIP